MKLPFGLLLLSLALTVLARAERAMPVQTEAVVVMQHLVWPEIKDPQALINFAKSKIKKFNDENPNSFQNAPTNMDREFDYLKPRECWLGRGRLSIIMDTHPYTGQALFITPDPAEYWEHHKQQRADVIHTKDPEINFVLAQISPNASGLFEAMKEESVQWVDFVNLDKETCSWPQPLEMRYPAFPIEFLKIGMAGRAKIIISISEKGLATLLKLDVTHKELESPISDAVQSWRFEPGVNLKTRMPTKTRIALTVNFDLKD